MKIGIFTNYPPTVPMSTEGLGRYLATLVKGFIENGDEVVIATPKWSEASLSLLIKGMDIDSDKVKFLTTSREPVFWKFYKFVHREKREKANSSIYEYVKKYVFMMSKMKMVSSFLGLGIIGGILGLFYSFIQRVKKIVNKKSNCLKRTVGKISILEIVRTIGNVTFNYMSSNEAKELVYRINKSPKMDIWYAPALFWPQVNDIKNQAVVINVPDLVTEVFATGFVELTDAYQTIQCRKTLDGGKNFITYCDYIGRELIDKCYFAAGDKKWKAILHSNHDMLPAIKISGYISKQMGQDRDLTYDFAKVLISRINCKNEILTGKQLSNCEYIFYASQARPHKNILNLIKAYNLLIRKRFRHERLVLTGNIDGFPEIENYINENDLTNDIVICYGVTNQELAALYCCAKLVVNPTLYEGGFPFTFGEGMSVGTPSIMSDIPQVRDVLEPAGLEEIMFNPFDYINMADKIEWGLENSQILYSMEYELYEQMAKRTDSIVAKEYRDEFQRIVSGL